MLTDTWRKSSRSEIHGACVECRTSWSRSTRCESSHCAEVWVRSTRCGDSFCAEVARPEDRVLLRDSKDLAGPVLTFTPSSWNNFLDQLPSISPTQ